jgi:hypothetical protein
MKNSFKETLVVVAISLVVGAGSFHFLVSEPRSVEYEKKAEELQEKYILTLRAFAIQDSIIKIGEEKRNLNIKNRDSLEGVIHYGVNKIDSLTVISIDSNDLNEAMRWLDSISH